MVLIHSLPIELLHRIIGFVQAERRQAFSARDSDLFARLTEDLLIISRVSTHFHSIVNAHLYQTIILSSVNLSPFLRTALSSVKLRSLVQDVSFEFQTSVYSGHAGPCFDNYVDLSKIHTLSADVLATWTFSILGIPEEFSENFTIENPDTLVIPSDTYASIPRERQSRFPCYCQEEASLLLLILSKLRHLRISTPEESNIIHGRDGEIEGFFRCRMLKAFLDSAHSASISTAVKDLPSSLQSLREFTFGNPYSMPGTVKTAYPPILFWPIRWLFSVFKLPVIRKIASHGRHFLKKRVSYLTVSTLLLSKI